jgi:GH25 family lysozyme M1 (1,4-beta-N-acetylmuramidase)
MAKKGIDVSYANGNIDWSKVKGSGIEFAILRSTFGSESPSQIDSQYFQNAQGCVKNNIPFATYHFAYFVNEQTAKDEADFAIKKANEYKNYIKFIVLDVEEDSVRYAKNMGYNPDWTACSVAFMERVKNAGYIPVLYSNYSWLKNIFNYNKLKNYKLWYAAPDVNKPAFDCAIWQYSWKGKVNGISGDVDMNYLYDDSLFATKTTITKTSTLQTATNSSKSSINIDVNYKVYANNKWLPTVKNTTDYAGLENKSIYGVYAKPTKGHLKYRVKLVNGGWLPWVQDMEDFAGATNLNRQIDCIQMTFTGVSGYSVEYRVATVSSNNYLPWVKNYNNINDEGYAGIKGVAIDKLQVKIVKN